MVRRPLLPVLLAIVTSACVQLPELQPFGADVPPAEAYPALVPLAPVLAATDGGATRTVGVTEDLEARAASLRGAAGQVRGTRVSGEKRAAADLRARAAILRGDASDIDALRARLDAL